MWSIVSFHRSNGIGLGPLTGTLLSTIGSLLTPIYLPFFAWFLAWSHQNAAGAMGMDLRRDRICEAGARASELQNCSSDVGPEPRRTGMRIDVVQLAEELRHSTDGRDVPFDMV